jgi:hypothetical protein
MGKVRIEPPPPSRPREMPIRSDSDRTRTNMIAGYFKRDATAWPGP